ncbi:PREDICTED: cell wall protein IFF6-like [Branchiostoma belcheri]|uniref:Cell wall protein IFF6-like n=1 Tax=Branchiostoma belcheri TaxID=7741 RepID=A0A6P4ZCT0_BRABE|nr:PREDICTED: cell wall protein IFF6-like [Branchiostoma belcheri]
MSLKVQEVVRPSDYEKYGLQENYCRNPFSDSRPLCFVNPDDSEHSFYWDFCPIPNCNPTTTLATTTPTRTSSPTTAKRHVTPQLPRALSTTASRGGPSPAGITDSLQPGHTHARPSSRVSRITQVTPHSGGLLQKSTEKSAVEACRLDQFECGSDKRCISRQSVCDNLVDCSDRSDEEDCAFRCAADEFFCDDLCYPSHFTCDGWDDCEDGSDEDPANCLTTSQPLPDGGVDSGDQGGDSNEQSQNIGDSENGDGLTRGRENGTDHDQNSSGINGDGDSASHSGTNGTNEYQNDTRYEGNNGTNLQDGGSHGNNSDLHGSGRGSGGQGNGGQVNGAQGNGGQGNGGQGNGGQGNGGQGNGGQGNGQQGNGQQGNGQQGNGGGIYDGDGKGIHNLSDYEEIWLRFNLTVKNATRLPCPCFVFGRQLVGRSSASFVNVTVVFHFVVTIVMMRLTSHILE